MRQPKPFHDQLNRKLMAWPELPPSILAPVLDRAAVYGRQFSLQRFILDRESAMVQSAATCCIADYGGFIARRVKLVRCIVDYASVLIGVLLRARGPRLTGYDHSSQFTTVVFVLLSVIV